MRINALSAHLMRNAQQIKFVLITNVLRMKMFSHATTPQKECFHFIDAMILKIAKIEAMKLIIVVRNIKIFFRDLNI
jgi:hypothetical protein